MKIHEISAAKQANHKTSSLPLSLDDLKPQLERSKISRLAYPALTVLPCNLFKYQDQFTCFRWV